MMEKSTLVLLIIVICGLMVLYTACGEDDGGVEPGQSAECQNCPCKFYDLSMTAECWDSNTSFLFASIVESFICQMVHPNEAEGVHAKAIVQRFPDKAYCTYSVPSPDACGSVKTNQPDGLFLNVTGDQAAACGACLEQYAKDLNDAGFPVNHPASLTWCDICRDCGT
jgi:hypothetical protein